MQAASDHSSKEDQREIQNLGGAARPAFDPAMRFIALLIEDYADE